MVRFEKVDLHDGALKNGENEINEINETKVRMEIDGFYKEVIKKFNKCEVDYLLVGGLAVGFYGYARFTGDMDLWINPTNANLDKLGNALKSLGYEDAVIEKVTKLRPVDHPTPIRLISEDDIFQVDVMTSIYYEPLSYEKCKESSKELKLSGFQLPVIGLKELIEVKSNVNRGDGGMKDLIDVHELRKILELGKTKEIEKKPSFLNKIKKHFSNEDKGLSR